MMSSRLRKASQLLVLVLTLPLGTAAAWCVGDTARKAAISPTTNDATEIAKKGYVVREIGDRLYWLSDGAYNTMFLVSPEGVVVVDPLPTLGPN